MMCKENDSPQLADEPISSSPGEEAPEQEYFPEEEWSAAAECEKLPEEEWQALREKKKAVWQGFFTGAVSAGLVIAAGGLVYSFGRSLLVLVSRLSGVPDGALFGLILLAGLALLVRRKPSALARWLVDILFPENGI